MNKKILVVSSVAVIVALFILGARIFQQQQQKQVSTNSAQLLRDSAMRLGEASAPVLVVEFFDPECESCKVFHPMTKMLLEEFKGQIQLVYRYAPFHPNSRFAIKVLEAARKQNRYWETLDILYAYQPQWGDHHHPNPELIWQYLPEAGVDVAKIRTDLEDPATTQLIEQDAQDAQTLGVRFTPTFFVNGEMLSEHGYQNLRELVLKHIKN